MYRKNLHIHFVGIGGIGMSGIAAILKQQGYFISGCDQDCTQKSIALLKALGCIIKQGNNLATCHDKSIDILVYSSAIAQDNPEITAAQQRGIPTISRALMLAELMRTKFSIAIAGSHGKTTTTSLVSHILLQAKLDPTVIIGGHLHNIGSNSLHGAGDFVVAEADESDRSLTHLHATFGIITNIDYEHVETYKNIDDLKQTFKQFLHNIPFYGKAIVCIDNPYISELIPLPHAQVIKYGSTMNADIYYTNLKLHENTSTFCVKTPDNSFNATLNMPGEHNVLNALAAIAVASELNIDNDIIINALASFPGVDRRFTYKGTFQGARIYDDYGHHPVEIEKTFHIIKQQERNKTFVIFQPHRYTRTHVLWQDFINILNTDLIDHLLITDIHPANEQPIKNIHSQRLVDELKKKSSKRHIGYYPYEASFNAIIKYLSKHAQNDDLILLLGAGKITKLGPLIVQKP